MSLTHERQDGHGQAFYLGDWVVEPDLDRISRDGKVVQLRPRAMDVLRNLAATAGELAPKRDLIDVVWRTEFVSEHALTQVIAELRAALGDDARNPTYIENIPRRGYRLVAPVIALMSEVPSAESEITLPLRIRCEDTDYRLSQGSNVIGRTPDATVMIDRTEVSRCHARIIVKGTTATLEDLDSKNGTYLNGHRVEGPSVLNDGDEIWIGRSITRLTFIIEGEPTQTEPSVT